MSPSDVPKTDKDLLQKPKGDPRATEENPKVASVAPRVPQDSRQRFQGFKNDPRWPAGAPRAAQDHPRARDTKSDPRTPPVPQDIGFPGVRVRVLTIFFATGFKELMQLVPEAAAPGAELQSFSARDWGCSSRNFRSSLTCSLRGFSGPGCRNQSSYLQRL